MKTRFHLAFIGLLAALTAPAQPEANQTTNLVGGAGSTMPGGQDDPLISVEPFTPPIPANWRTPPATTAAAAGLPAVRSAAAGAAVPVVELGIDGGRVVARQGAFGVSFSSDAFARGAVELATPEKFTVRSTVLGLWYIEPGGESVMVATLRPTAVQLLRPNRVLYPDAFDGDGVRADLVYTITRTSLEQDVVLRQQLPDPAQWGFSTNCQVALVTEFFDSPPVRKTVRQVDLSGYYRAIGMEASPETPDETLFIKSMRLQSGKAFVLGRADNSVPVCKTFVRLDGRDCLIESVPYCLLKKQLDALPLTAMKAGASPAKSRLAKLLLPKAPPQRPASRPVRLASAGLDASPGVVLDYLITTSPLINVDLAVWSAKSGTAAAGYDSSDYWNTFDCTGYPSAALTDLLDSAQNQTQVGIEASNAENATYNPACADPMYSSYMYPANANRIILTITNLPADEYDVFVYAPRATPAGAPVIELKRAGTTLWTKGNNPWGQGWHSSLWEDGEQYARFQRIAITNQALVLESWPDASGVASVAGLQIVPSLAITPEPTIISNLLNVDFAGSSTNKVGLAATGLSANDYWNGYVYGGQRAVSVTDLKWSDQTTSGVGMVVHNAPGAWGVTMFDPMLGNYIYAGQGNITVTLTNLPTGIYDFYLYGHTINPADHALFELWSGEVNAGWRGTSQKGYGPTTNRWEAGQQYVRFRDVGVVSNSPVLIQSSHNALGYNTFSGMQVVRKGDLESDGDGLPDAWELAWFGNLDQSGTNDADGDLLSNLREYQLGFEPNRADSDGNGVNDWAESQVSWVKDTTPPGAYTYASGDTWNWVTSWSDGTGWGGATVYPLQGSSRMHVSALVSGAAHKHYFERSAGVIRPATGDVLYAYINLDSTYPPAEVMIEFYVMETNGYASFEHRAYWGANNISTGTNNTPSRYPMGSLPGAGEWARLEVPASALNLEGRIIQGMSFTLWGGRAAWDRAGKLTPDMDGDGWLDAIEIEHFGDISKSPAGDEDGDGLPNIIDADPVYPDTTLPQFQILSPEEGAVF